MKKVIWIVLAGCAAAAAGVATFLYKKRQRW